MSQEQEDTWEQEGTPKQYWAFAESLEKDLHQMNTKHQAKRKAKLLQKYKKSHHQK